MTPYAMHASLPGLAFPEALERTRRALADQRFGIPVDMDTQAIFLQKLGRESPAQVILGACLAPVAYEALAAEPDMAVLLPCSVAVREVGGGCEVAAVRPTALFGLTGSLDSGHAEVVESKLRAALAALEHP